MACGCGSTEGCCGDTGATCVACAGDAEPAKSEHTRRTARPKRASSSKEPDLSGGRKARRPPPVVPEGLLLPEHEPVATRRTKDFRCGTDLAEERRLEGGRRLKADGKLRPSGSLPPSSPIETLLIPGFAIERPRHGNLMATVPAALRKAGVDRLAGTGGTILLHRRFRPSQEAGALSPDPGGMTRIDRSELQALSGILRGDPDEPIVAYSHNFESDPPDSGNAGTIGAYELFKYRSAWLLIPSDWYAEYFLDWQDLYSAGHDVSRSEANGLVRSMTDALDGAWPRFRAAARGDHDTYHDMLGCYNLPEDHSTELVDMPIFWKLGWGPAHAVYLYACQLLRTYCDFLDASELRDCEGMPAFVEDALRGNEATNNKGDACTVHFNFRNDDRNENNRVNDSCNYGDERCDIGTWVFRDDSGAFISELESLSDWDVLSPVFRDEFDCIGDSNDSDRFCETTNDDFGGNWDYYEDLWTPYGHDINLSVVHLAFRGYVCDYIMFFARLGLDYAEHGGLNRTYAAETVLQAERMGRYAIRHIMKLSGVMAHELGHVWLGEHGHCSQQCCMDIARHRFDCKLRGELGLPELDDNDFSRDAGQPSYSDWTQRDHHYTREYVDCSEDDGFTVTSCDLGLGNNGEEGVNADYCSSTYCFKEFDPLFGSAYYGRWDTRAADDPATHCENPYAP